MPPNLPQELIECIIDFLHDDDESLKACSLTCRAWVIASRYHLFSSIAVSLVTGSSPSVTNLLQTIQGNSAVANNIIELQLKGRSIAEPSSSGTTIDTQEIVTLTSSLPRLSTLYCFGDFDTFIDYIQSPVTSTVTTLSLYATSYTEPTKLSSFVSSFPNLERLALPRQFFLNKTRYPVTKYPAISPKLHWLQLTLGMHSWLISGWIRSFADQLRYFEVHITSRAGLGTQSLPDPAAVHFMLWTLGYRITHLHMNLSGWYSNPFHLTVTDGLENLQELELNSISLARDNNPDINDWIYKALESIKSSQLTKASFGLKFDCLIIIEDCLAKFDWARFEDSLSRAQFSRLNVIELVVDLETSSVTQEGAAEQCLDKSVPISDMLRSRLPSLFRTSKSVSVVIHDADSVLPYYRIF